jgi:hypothetical protein
MAGRPKGSPKTGGRKAGTPNRVTADLKAAVLAAFDQAGGVSYLVSLAKTNSTAFCTLLGKVLPTQITGNGGGPLETRHTFDLANLTDEQLAAYHTLAAAAARTRAGD